MKKWTPLQPVAGAINASRAFLEYLSGLERAIGSVGGGGVWGAITGTLSAQTDLQTALNGKQPLATVLTNTTAAFTTAQETKLSGIATGANLYVHPNHTGDVTSTGDGVTAIAADAVTNAKLANMAANSIKINNTGSAADPIDGTVAQVKTLLAYTAADVGAAATSHTHTASQISDSTTAGRAMITAADAAAQTALLNAFTSGLKGLVPSSGGGTTTFLRADGTFATPAGGSSVGPVVGWFV